MNKIKSGIYTYYLGQRVAALVGTKGNWYYGWIGKLGPSGALIYFDNGQKKSVAFKSIYPVVQWKEVKNSVHIDSLEITGQPPHEVYDSTSFDLTPLSVSSSWLYANLFGFDGKLKPPTLHSKITDRNFKRAFGLCYDTAPTRIELNSNRIKTAKVAFDILVHEMVHQANFEVDKVDYDKEEGHGPSFMKYATKIKSSLSVDINQYINEFDIILKSDYLSPEDAKKTMREGYNYFAVVTYNLLKGSFPVSFIVNFKDGDIARAYYQQVFQQISQREEILSLLYYRATITGYARVDVGWQKMDSAFELLYGEPYLDSKREDKSELFQQWKKDSASASLTIYRTQAKLIGRLTENKKAKAVNAKEFLKNSNLLKPKSLDLIKKQEVAEFTTQQLINKWRD